MKYIMLASFAVFILVTACSSQLTKGLGKKITVTDVDGHVRDWPKDSRGYARKYLKTLGAPQAVTDEMLVWENVKGDPYRRTVVHKSGVPHDGHLDLVEYHRKDFSRLCAIEVVKVSDW